MLLDWREPLTAHPSLRAVEASPGRLVAHVHASGFDTGLSLLDDQGRLLIQSEATSPTNPDDQIDQHLPAGIYYLAVAGDEIYADAASIVGSIGVIFAGFGFVDAIEKLGITRRVYAAGANKGSLDSFRPERADDVEHLKSLQQDVHDVFIGVVSRGG